MRKYLKEGNVICSEMVALILEKDDEGDLSLRVEEIIDDSYFNGDLVEYDPYVHNYFQDECDETFWEIISKYYQEHMNAEKDRDNLFMIRYLANPALGVIAHICSINRDDIDNKLYIIFDVYDYTQEEEMDMSTDIKLNEPDWMIVTDAMCSFRDIRDVDKLRYLCQYIEPFEIQYD